MNDNVFLFRQSVYIRELKRECAARRRVWATRAGGEGKFVRPDHQLQYDILDELCYLLEKLGDRRTTLVQEKITAELKAQQELLFPEPPERESTKEKD